MDLLCQKSDTPRNSSVAPPDGQCCKKDNAICAAPGECCSGTCNDTTRRCTPSAESDAARGQTCGGPGLFCTYGSGCCPGLQCDGPSGRCCAPNGSDCSSAGECCSKNCVEGGGGVFRCSAQPAPPPPPIPVPDDAVRLLEPIGGMSFVSGGGIGVLMAYIAGIWPWLVGIGFGVALLQVIFAGYEIMMSGGSPALREQGKQRILWSIIGMLMLLSAAAILNLINPGAYGIS